MRKKILQIAIFSLLITTGTAFNSKNIKPDVKSFLENAIKKLTSLTQEEEAQFLANFGNMLAMFLFYDHQDRDTIIKMIKTDQRFTTQKNFKKVEKIIDNLLQKISLK